MTLKHLLKKEHKHDHGQPVFFPGFPEPRILGNLKSSYTPMAAHLGVCIFHFKPTH